MLEDIEFIGFENFDSIKPEIFLAAIAILVLSLSFSKKLSVAIHWVVLAGIVFHAVWVGTVSSIFTTIGTLFPEDHSQTNGYIFRALASVAAALTIVALGRQKMEFYLLLLSILVGTGLLIGANDFITIVLSVELISIPSYILTAGSDPDKNRAEAAWKFFLFGSVATAVMIFGMSYVFGATGSMQISWEGVQSHPTMFMIGMLMMLGGFLFKLTAAPFHLWAPDVYEATPSPIAAFLSVVPKLAGISIILRVLYALNTENWNAVIAGFAILSILIGTLAAIGQKNAKRMMAYSSVAHAGFLLTAIISLNSDTIIYYAVVFLVMNYTVFLIIHIKEKTGPALYENFAGMGYAAPIAGVAATLAFVSLTGIPPMAGFMAKLLVFTNLWKVYVTTNNPIFGGLFVVGLLATVASLFFYLKIPFYLFFRRSEENEAIKISPFTNLLLLILVGILLVLFVVPSAFDGLAE